MRILFIGNSFTARNDVPGTVAALAGALGHATECTLIAANGAPLRAHWNKGLAAAEIARGHYDVVVLQEQSTLPVKNAARMLENIRLFDEVIRGAGARTALYETWARVHAPDSQALISEAYRAAANELGALLVPAGTAFEHFAAKHATPSLYDKDGSHPSPAGSYLAACVCVVALLGANPTGVAAVVKGIADDDIARLQRVAWATAKPTGRKRT